MNFKISFYWKDHGISINRHMENYQAKTPYRSIALFHFRRQICLWHLLRSIQSSSVLFAPLRYTSYHSRHRNEWNRLLSRYYSRQIEHRSPRTSYILFYNFI